MKGNSPLFACVGNKTFKPFDINLQLFASKRVSDCGVAIQSRLENQKLKNLVGELYREGAKVGDGSAMAAASYQVKTGKLVGGKDHVIKINERLSNLTHIIEKQSLSESDLKYAKNLRDKMIQSLKGKY